MMDGGEDRAEVTVFIFATIHFRSEQRPAGYTSEEVAAINQSLKADTTTAIRLAD